MKNSLLGLVDRSQVMLQSTKQQLRLLYWKWRYIQAGLRLEDAKAEARCKVLGVPYVEKTKVVSIR